jgi:hydroxymethylglutaryl-CoA synthase
MVRKAWNKLMHFDIHRFPNKHAPISDVLIRQALDFGNRSHYAMINDYAEPLWNKRVEPSLSVGREIGNIYTGSLFAGLLSLITNVDLVGKKVAMFSYGSGSTSSLFTLTFRSEAAEQIQKIRET